MDSIVEYHLSQLVSVVTKYKRISKIFVYKPHKILRFFWIFKEEQKEGFYTIPASYEGRYYTKQQLENGEFGDTQYIVEDDKVYLMPEVTLYFSNGREAKRTFYHDEHAKNFADKVKANRNNPNFSGWMKFNLL